LKDEIRITKPDVVVFITGWDYEQRFQEVFSGLTYKTIEENYIYKVIHPLLPGNSYMTMHPNGLNFRKKLNLTIDLLIKEINN
jgi:hypothetical protein